MSGQVINFISIVGGALLAIPSITSLFTKPAPANTIVITIGVGDVNSSTPLPDG